jgi:hypothetical protein
MISLVNGVSLWSILTARNLTDLDALLAPSYGYTSVHDYYGDCAPAPHAHNISVPTLALSAIDDPVCNHAAAPLPLSTKGSERNIYTCMHMPLYFCSICSRRNGILLYATSYFNIFWSSGTQNMTYICVHVYIFTHHNFFKYMNISNYNDHLVNISRCALLLDLYLRVSGP